MNFEKRMKKRGNQKLDKFAKNPYHVPWFKKIPTWVKIATPAVLTSAAAATIVIVMMPTFANKSYHANMNIASGSVNYIPSANNGKSTPTSTHDYQPSSSAFSSQQSNPTESWGSKAFYQKYPSILYQEVTYVSLVNSLDKTIDASLINEKITDLVLSTKDDKNATVNANVSLYSIKGVAIDVSIAVKEENEENYYVYYNKDLYFANIGQFLTKTSFTNLVNISSIMHSSVKPIVPDANMFVSYVQSEVYDILFNDQTVVGYLSSDSGATQYLTASHVYYFNLSSSTLSIEMALYSNDCLVIDFASKQEIYKIADSSYQALTTYLQNHLTV